MKTIQVGEGLQIDVHDGPEPVMYLHNNDDNGFVVVRPGQITALRDALAEAGGVAAAMVAGEDVRAKYIREYERLKQENGAIDTSRKALAETLVECLKRLEFAQRRDPDNAGIYNCNRAMDAAAAILGGAAVESFRAANRAINEAHREGENA